MNVYLIDTGRTGAVESSRSSFLRWSEGVLPEPVIVSEGEIREATLNRILAMAQGEDALVLADDIRFPPPGQPGSSEEAAVDPWDLLAPDPAWSGLLGFGMVDPAGGRVRNAGFDLVEVDGKKTLRPREAGKRPEEAERFRCREAFAVTGCALWIGRALSEAVPEIPAGGMHRWEEILYAAAAWKNGFAVGVLGLWLEHDAVSTKGHADSKYGSDSYALEKEGWENRVAPFLPEDKLSARYTRRLSPALSDWLADPAGAVVYGAGTVAEYLLEQADLGGLAQNLEIVSGLPEEDGVLFAGRTIRHRDRLRFHPGRRVLVTVQGKEKEIGRWLRSRQQDLHAWTVTVRAEGETILYDLGGRL